MLSPRFLHFLLAIVLVTGLFTATGRGASAHLQQPLAARAAANVVSAPVPAVRREVFGFALASSLSDPTVGYPSWNFSLLSTVAFFGLHIADDGTVVADNGWSVWNSSTLSSLLSAAHSKGTKVVLTIVLQDFQPGTPDMCAGLVHRAVTAGEAAAQVAAKGVDGVNVDYEGLNGTCPNGQTSQAMFTDFMRQLRAALPASAYLSVDTYASSASDTLGFFDVAGLNAYVDSFFVMAYDLEYSNYRRSPINCPVFCLGPTAPLSAYYYNDTTSTSQYIAVVPASKVLLGVPYYGRKACVGGAAPNAVPTSSVVADTYLDASTESSDPNVRSGSYAAHRDANDPAGQERWDTWYNASLSCTRELYWDDATSLGAKYDLVNQDSLRGVGIWNLNYGGGAPELWSALATHFSGCQSAALTTSPASSAVIGSTVTIAASSAGCPTTSPLYQFWMSDPTTGWHVVQPYSPASTYSWSTAVTAPGSYGISVWVRDGVGVNANNSGRWDAFASATYTLTAVPCSAATLTAAQASVDARGATVTFAASAGSCRNPVYQFWIAAPGGGWRIVQPYSAAGTYSWNTSTSVTGLYGVSVWAREATGNGVSGNNSGRWDTYATIPYTLIPPCSGATLSESPSPTAASGATVKFTAAAAGCANPIFQFWMAAPGGGWQVVQAYSTSSSLLWATAGKPVGTYGVSVWVRDGSSSGIDGNNTGHWDAYATAAYPVTPYSCSSAVLSPSPASSAAVGTSVALQASASGCANPVYEFWISDPATGAWHIAQTYSSASTFTWNSAGLASGNYSVSVWVRDASSTGVQGNNTGRFDAYATTTYALTPYSCSAVNLTATPASPVRGVTTVTLNATGAGCPNPVYQFWVATPSGGWHLVEAYSTTGTFTFTTSGTGTYGISVWARDASSTGVYGNNTGRWDAYASATYSVS